MIRPATRRRRRPVNELVVVVVAVVAVVLQLVLLLLLPLVLAGSSSFLSVVDDGLVHSEDVVVGWCRDEGGRVGALGGGTRSTRGCGGDGNEDVPADQGAQRKVLGRDFLLVTTEGDVGGGPLPRWDGDKKERAGDGGSHTHIDEEEEAFASPDYKEEEEEGDEEEEEEEGGEDEQEDEDDENDVDDDEDDDIERDAASEWTVLEYWKLLECDHFYQRNPRPTIHELSTWFYLRGLYVGVVSAHRSMFTDDDSDEPTQPNGNATTTLQESFRSRRRQRNRRLRDEMAASQVSWNHIMAQNVGFQVPVTVQHTNTRGRGVFATNLIPKDTVVSVGGDEARFLSADSYRAFVESAPIELQCDLLQFSYFDVELIHGEATDVILVALNDEAYLNADWSEDGDEANIVGIEYDIEEMDESTSPVDSDRPYLEQRRIEYVAKRNIEAGEELVLKYVDFLHNDGWHVFGL